MNDIKTRANDFSKGSILKHILRLAIPMTIAQLITILYNIVDRMFIGRIGGVETTDALTGVGVCLPIVTIIMAFSNLIGAGAAPLISIERGRNNGEESESILGNACSLLIIVGISISVLGLCFKTPILKLLGASDATLPYADSYITIYLIGAIFPVIALGLNSIINAQGFGKTGMLTIAIGAMLNIILDPILIFVFNMGVAGVGWATFIAQGISSLLAFAVLLKRVHGIKSGTYKKFSIRMLGHISRIAIPSILQQSFVSVGNLFIQSRVNSFGSDVIAGYSAAIKLNTFAITSFSTLGNAMSSYTAQNTGARKLLRIPEGLKAGIVMLIVVSLPFFIAYFVFPNTMMNIFVKSSETDIIDVGRIFLKIVTPFYFVISAKLTFDGILRGAGRMKAFMASTFTDLLLRVILAYVFSYALNSEVGIWLSWPVGWTIAAVISAVFYFIYYKTTIKNGAN